MEAVHFNSLYGAVEGDELNPLYFNPDDYPDMSVMIDHLLKNNLKAPVALSPRKLSKNGTVRREAMKRYLAAKYASSSALKEAIKSPAHYFFYANDKANFEEKRKDCFELGTFAHMAFLEPELFKKCHVDPGFKLNSTNEVIAGIHYYEKLKRLKKHDRRDLAGYKIDDLRYYLAELKETCGYTIVDKKHKLIIDCIAKNYYRYGGGIIPLLLKGAAAELSFYSQDTETGLNVKVRPDAINYKENIGVDAIISFKTTSAPTIGKFLYDSAKFVYELSEGMYQQVVSEVTGRQFNSTIMIMLQTVPPFLPAVFWWTPEDLQNGKYKYKMAKQIVADCEVSGLWPGFEALAESGNYGIIDMQQPEWSKKLLAPVDVEN